MTLGQLLSLIAAGFGAAGSVYALKSFLTMTPAITAALATPRWDYSLLIVDSLSAQRADSIVGAGAFALAFVLGGFSIAMTAPIGSVVGSRLAGVLLAIGVVIAVMLGGHFLAGVLRRSHQQLARGSLILAEFDRTIATRSYDCHHTDSLAHSAGVLLDIIVPRDNPNEVLRVVAAALGRTLPADIPVIPPAPVE